MKRSFWKRATGAMLLIAMLVTLLAACGGSGGGGGNSGEEDNDLTFLISYEPTAISPGAGTKGVDMSISNNFYDTLIFEDGEDRTTYVPGIASEWSFSEDGTQLTFTIRDDVQFHDGTTLTVDDVVFSLNYALTQAANGAVVDVISDVQATGDNQVTITMNYPYAPMLAWLATPGFGIISQAFYEQCEEDGTNFQRVENGTGPYILDTWESGTQLTAHANENWFYGDVPIESVTWQVAQDSTTAAMMMENGQADAYFSPAASDVQRLDDLENVDNTWPVSYATYMIEFNITKPPFDDPALREAIAYGIDREAILQGGRAGVGQVQPCPVAPGFFGYVEDLEVPEYDLEKAKQMLADAGYPEGSLSVTLRTASDTWYSLPAQVVQSQFEAMGINCELEIMENAAYQTSVMNEHDFEVTYYNSQIFINDADGVLWNEFHTGGVYNTNGVSDPEVDQLLETARQSMDDDVRLDCYRQVIQKIVDNNWSIYTDIGYNSMVYNTDLNGVFPNNAGIYKLSYWSW